MCCLLRNYCKFLTSLLQIIELRMCALSNHIRERPNWWEEVKYKAIIENWREEILQRGGASNEAPSRRLTPAMVKRPYFESRSTTYSKNSTDTHLCVIQ